MGYYQGDFYRGARGDPGFFSFIGSAARSLLGLPPAAAAPAASTAITKIVQTAAPIVKRGLAIVKSHPVLTAAGAAGAAAAGGAALGRMSAGSRAGAGMAQRMVGGGGGRRRRMNPCNPRALRRAIRRTHSFAKLAMRTIRLVHPGKKARFGGFRKKKAHK